MRLRDIRIPRGLAAVGRVMSRVTVAASAILVLASAKELLLPRHIVRDRIYSERQAARFLRVKKERLLDLIESQQLFARAIDGRYLILGRALLDYLGDASLRNLED